MPKRRALTDAAKDPLAKKENLARPTTTRQAPTPRKRPSSKPKIQRIAMAGVFILGVIGGLYLSRVFRFRLWL